MRFNNLNEELYYLKCEILKGNVDVFYKSLIWRNKRKDILERDHHECQKCKKIKHKLTKQQYRTIKGQIKAGDILGANRGLDRLIIKRKNASRHTAS